MIRTTTPNRSNIRLQADYRRNRAFVAGLRSSASPLAGLICARAAAATAQMANGTTVTFGSNVLRAVDRGAVVERPATQLMTNPSLAGAEGGSPGKVPTGWRLPAGSVLLSVALITVNGLPGITVELSAVNASATAAGLTLNLEPAAGIAVPASRRAVFSASTSVVSASNVGDVSTRLIGRNSSGTGVGDQGRGTVPAGNPAPIVTAPAIDDSAVALFPVLTWSVAALSTGILKFTLIAPQVTEGSNPTTFIPRSPPAESRENRYPNPGLTGAAAGTPGTPPTYWSNATMTSSRILAVNGDGSIDIELSATAGASAAIPAYRLNVPPPGGPAGLIAAAAGQTWEASVEAQVLSGPADANPRLNFTARNSSGSTISGFNTSASFVSTTSLASVGRRFESLPDGVAGLQMQILLSIPAGETRTVQLRIRAPRCDLITLVAGSGSAVREQDVVSWANPSVFAGPSTVIIEAEMAALDAGATLLALAFGGGHRLRLVAGDYIGVIVTSPGGPPVSALAPIFAPPGVIRLALSYANGQVNIAFSDACDGGAASLSVPGLDVGTVTGAWFGSDAGANGMTSALRSIDIRSGARPASDLRQRTRAGWFARTMVAPIAGLRSPDLASVPPYEPPANIVVGPSMTYSWIGNRYWKRSNGGAPMSDHLPHANSVGSIEGSPRAILVINNDASATLTIDSLGGNIYAPADEVPYLLPPVPQIVVAAQKRLFIQSDGYDGPTAEYVTGNDNWWYVERDNDLINLQQAYSFPSVYGPINTELNASRAVLYPPASSAYNADIGPCRQMSAYAVAAANRWVYYRSAYDAARAMRTLRDACAADYWRISLPPKTTITQLKTQITSTGMAYLQIRDAGVGTAQDHAVIREWFRDRTEQTIAFYDAEAAAGTGTARGNHVYAAALACATAAEILDRADYYRWAVGKFELAMQDSASIPGNTGSMLLELRRADKAVQYHCLAMTQLMSLAESLIRMGYDAYGYLGGQLIKCVNFVAATIDNPSLMTAEQQRLVNYGGAWAVGMVVATQQSLGFSRDIDPITGEQLFNESRVAWLYYACGRLTDQQMPSRPIWVPRAEVYDNNYNGSTGGAYATIRPFPGINVPPPPPPVIA
ncbi:MAG: alginate lyase family protein [Gammaproteobacteria bacterium]|jgi:hypothetical protein|nr:alginate lyase family protein [Gammaproteobacteria bacterium]